MLLLHEFAAQLSSVFPDEFRFLLKNIGIDPLKEGEVYELGPEGDRRIYGGWFYFSGEIIKAGERNVTPPLTSSIGSLMANAFRNPPPIPVTEWRSLSS